MKKENVLKHVKLMILLTFFFQASTGYSGDIQVKQANPISFGHIDDGGYARGIYVSGAYAYLTNNDDGLRIYKLTGVHAPTAGIGSLDAGNAAVRNNLIVGNDAYVKSGLTVGKGGIHVETGNGVRVDGDSVFWDKVGIGTVSAMHRLHVHEQSSSRAYAHFTNDTTGNTDGNGVAVGLDQDEDFRVHSFESNNLKFFVNNIDEPVKSQILVFFFSCNMLKFYIAVLPFSIFYRFVKFRFKYMSRRHHLRPFFQSIFYKIDPLLTLLVSDPISP